MQFMGRKAPHTYRYLYFLQRVSHLCERKLCFISCSSCNEITCNVSASDEFQLDFKQEIFKGSPSLKDLQRNTLPLSTHAFGVMHIKYTELFMRRLHIINTKNYILKNCDFIFLSFPFRSLKDILKAYSAKHSL